MYLVQFENVIDSTIRVISTEFGKSDADIEARTHLKEYIEQLKNTENQVEVIGFFEAVLAILDDKPERRTLSDPRWNEQLQRIYDGLANYNEYYTTPRRMRSLSTFFLASYTNVLYGHDNIDTWKNMIKQHCESTTEEKGEQLQLFSQWVSALVEDEATDEQDVANAPEVIAAFTELKTSYRTLNLPFSHCSEVINTIHCLKSRNTRRLGLWLWQSGVRRTEAEQQEDFTRRDFVDHIRRLLVARTLIPDALPPVSARSLNTLFDQGWQRILGVISD